MSWAGIANNQCVSFANLKDAVDTGVFISKTTQSTSLEQITKDDANNYVYIDTSYAPYAAKTSNQLVVKSDLRGGFILYGASYGCVIPETEILVAPDVTKRADALNIGDFVFTQHEQNKNWDYFKIVNIERKTQPLLKICTSQGDIVCSTTHLMLSGSNYFEAQQLSVNDYVLHLNCEALITEVTSQGEGEVIEFTIEDAHTYIAGGFFSHNKCVTVPWTNCTDACNNGATAYTSSVQYTGVLQVGTVISSTGACSITDGFYYYVGGFIEIVFNGTNFVVQSLNSCANCTTTSTTTTTTTLLTNITFDATTSACGYYITAVDVNGVAATLTGGAGLPFCTDTHNFNTTQTGNNETLNITVGSYVLNGCLTVVDSALNTYQQNVNGNGTYAFAGITINNTTQVVVYVTDNFC